MKHGSLFGLSVGSLVVGAVFFWAIFNFLNPVAGPQWKHVDGVVVEIKQYTKAGWRTNVHLIYNTIVEYKVDGKSFRHHDTHEHDVKPALGTTVDIAYDPSDPSRASTYNVDDKLSKSEASTAGILAASPFVLFAIVGFFFVIRGSRD